MWTIEERLPKSANTLLHFAPSQSVHTWLSQKNCFDITSADLAPQHYQFADDVVEADIKALPFEDDAFDFVICSHVMEHIDDDVKSFRQVKRVLRKNGVGFFMVPLVVDGLGPIEDPSVTSREGRLRHFGQPDHVRIYDAETFVARANEAELSIEVFDPHLVDPIKAIALGIGKGNAVFIARG